MKYDGNKVNFPGSWPDYHSNAKHSQIFPLYLSIYNVYNIIY